MTFTAELGTEDSMPANLALGFAPEEIVEGEPLTDDVSAVVVVEPRSGATVVVRGVT
ncbi:MAG TPA: hypothetical protein VFP09_11395 [Desertimonas sp.]|nr:hypothetical protein [Desertimonas sp.]